MALYHIYVNPNDVLGPLQRQEGLRAGAARDVAGACRGSFASRDSDIFPQSFCADSSSPQISVIFVGHFTGGNYALRKSPQFNSPQNFHKHCADKC